MISLCRYSQHDLSASGLGTVLVVRDGCHLAIVVLFVVEGCAGVFLVVAVGVIAMVAICGAIFVGCV